MLPQLHSEVRRGMTVGSTVLKSIRQPQRRVPRLSCNGIGGVNKSGSNIFHHRQWFARQTDWQICSPRQTNSFFCNVQRGKIFDSDMEARRGSIVVRPRVLTAHVAKNAFFDRRYQLVTLRAIVTFSKHRST